MTYERQQALEEFIADGIARAVVERACYDAAQAQAISKASSTIEREVRKTLARHYIMRRKPVKES